MVCRVCFLFMGRVFVCWFEGSFFFDKWFWKILSDEMNEVQVRNAWKLVVQQSFSILSKTGRKFHKSTPDKSQPWRRVGHFAQNLKVDSGSVWQRGRGRGSGHLRYLMYVSCSKKDCCRLNLIGMVVFTDKKCSHTESGSFTLRRNIQSKQGCQSMTRGSKERCFGLESLTGLAVARTRSWSTVLGLLKRLKFVHLNWTKNAFVEGN